MKLPKVIAWFASYHVQDVSMQRLFHLRSSRNAKDAIMPKEAESAVFFISMRTDGSSATAMLPAR